MGEHCQGDVGDQWRPPCEGERGRRWLSRREGRHPAPVGREKLSCRKFPPPRPVLSKRGPTSPRPLPPSLSWSTSPSQCLPDFLVSVGLQHAPYPPHLIVSSEMILVWPTFPLAPGLSSGCFKEEPRRASQALPAPAPTCTVPSLQRGRAVGGESVVLGAAKGAKSQPTTYLLEPLL